LRRGSHESTEFIAVIDGGGDGAGVDAAQESSCVGAIGAVK
jgi:hypothetical protein